MVELKLQDWEFEVLRPSLIQAASEQVVVRVFQAVRCLYVPRKVMVPFGRQDLQYCPT